MLRSSQDEPECQTPQTLLVDLTLASGSRAGVVVSIHPGYYLIGRDSECQIRPKSRSVSRRHCLLRHEAGQLHAVDLESTSGTRLNGERLKPRCWHPLADGDQLRCGKIAFDVQMRSVTEPSTSSTAGAAPQETEPVAPDAAAASAVIDAASDGKAWQAEDIADWMTGFDELEQAERVQGIRAPKSQPPDQTEPAGGPATEAPPATLQEPQTGAAASAEAPRRAASAGPTPTDKRKTSKPPRTRLSLPRLPLGGDREKLKAYAVGLLLLLAVGWLVWSFLTTGTQDIYQQIKTIDS